jgi:hypothetical protein
MLRESVREILNRKNLMGIQSFILKKINLNLLSEVLKEIINQDTFGDSRKSWVQRYPLTWMVAMSQKR